MLDRLIAIFLETVDEAHVAAVFIAERGRLILRGSRGLTTGHHETSLAPGEGFVGKVAADRAPFAVRNAASDPVVLDEALRADGVRGLYGVPLLHEGEVVVASFKATGARLLSVE